ncbi:MAG: RNA polymerase sigma factor [Alphaproteobacteria bacterium]
MTTAIDAPAGEEAALVAAARRHDRAAFDRLAAQHQRRLRAVVRRLVGHPDDTDELVQEALLRAWRSIADFRGDSAFGTWLCAIGARAAVDHLRGQRRWRARSQVAYANECAKSEDLAGAVGMALFSADHMYEAREHIAYCFTCVGRSLAPEDQAALVLRDVMDFGNREAAEALGISQGALRGRLTRARAEMTAAYDGLCALVNKTGACWQCKGLRDASPEGRKGEEPPAIADYQDRVGIVRAADVDRGRTQALHDACWRGTKRVEDEGRGSTEPESDCGH